MPSPLCVAAVQLSSGEDAAANLAAAVSHVRGAAKAGATFVTLPENFGYLASDGDKLRHVQDVEDGPFTAPLREVARELGIFILAGSIPERGPDPRRMYNTSVLIGRRGETLATYRKIHLFDVDLANGVTLTESAQVAPGQDVVVVDVDGWGVGLSICYDLRFPELYRRLVSAGARILTIPAAFTLHTGKDHWDVLVRARAIENQCFVVAPAQWGRHGGSRASWGKSLVVDTWGTPLATAPERPGFVTAWLDPTDQDRVRRELPALGHRVF